MMPGWMLACRLGWRNLRRNTRRSLITASAIAAAFAFLIILIGMMGGLREQMLRNGTQLLLGHLQVHHSDYLPDRNSNDTLGDAGSLEWKSLAEDLLQEPDVVEVSWRVYSFALLSTGDSSAGAQILGVDPVREARLTTFLETLQSGRNLGEEAARSILLGVGLARELGAEVGAKVAIVCQAADGSMGNDLYVVSGILRTGMSGLDRSLAVVHFQDLQELIALGPNRVHELAIGIADPHRADQLSAQLNERLLPLDARARPWGELAPQLRDYLNLSAGAGGFVIGLVALFAALGVLNTMMMAIFERTREFGMLSAMGMSPSLIFQSLLLESLFLAVFGLAAGLAVGSGALYHMSEFGWDLTRWTGELALMDTRIDPILRGVWVWGDIGKAAIGLLLATLIACLAPARRLFRLDPVEAMAAPAEG